MSKLDRWGSHETPCPDCGGEVEYWYFDCDCRGNPPSSGIACKKCGRRFTKEEWSAIEPPPAKKALHHDDPPCEAKLDERGDCPVCKLHPDMQSTAFHFCCPDCDVPLLRMRCPDCGTKFRK